jgi:hypothetical protein
MAKQVVTEFRGDQAIGGSVRQIVVYWPQRLCIVVQQQHITRFPHGVTGTANGAGQ